MLKILRNKFKQVQFLHILELQIKHSYKAFVTISVQPDNCLHDTAINISVSGLACNEKVTLLSELQESKDSKFFAYAYYECDENGLLNTNKACALGGLYKGCFPMGLIGGLCRPVSNNRYFRYNKRDVTMPDIIKFSVLEGHVLYDDLLQSNYASLASLPHKRYYLQCDVERISVKAGTIRGTLFMPKGHGPYSGVIDLYGTAGGLLEYRAAMLSAKGFAVLALAYFAYEDLPSHPSSLHISYFEEAVNFLLNHEKVKKNRIGVVGCSKGGDLVLSLAAFIPEIKAGVWINGCNANFFADLHLADKIIPTLNYDIDKVKFHEDGTLIETYYAMNDPNDYPDTIIPLEKADANFLFLVSEDDRNYPSAQYASSCIQRLREHGKKNYKVVTYAGAGHLLEPPYMPFCCASYHKVVGMNMLWGGSLQPHTEA